MKTLIGVVAILAVLTTTASANCMRLGNGNIACRQGNQATIQDPYGRLLLHGIRQGNVQYQYNASGRRVGTAYYNSNGYKVYNTRGQLIASSWHRT